MLKIFKHILTFTVISVSFFQEGAAGLKDETGGDKGAAGEKAYVMDVASNEKSGNAQNTYSGAEKQQSEVNKQSSGSAERKQASARQREVTSAASKESNNEKERDSSETSGKYQQSAGTRQQASYGSASKQQAKEQQASGNAVERGNTDTVHERFRQKSAGKYAGGRRWRGKFPRPWYGPYRARRPLLGYRKRSMWCRLYKARLRYLLMGYHRRHLGHFLPFGFHPGLRKYKTKSAYSEEQNHNKNININNNVNNNHKSKEQQDYQHSRDASSYSSTRLDQPQRSAKTNIEKNAYNQKAQSRDYEKSDNLQHENSKYTSDANQSKNTEYKSQEGEQQDDKAKYYSGATQNKNYAGKQQSGYNDEMEKQYVDDSNGEFNKNEDYGDTYGNEASEDQYKPPYKSKD